MYKEMAQFSEGTVIDPLRLLGIQIDDQGNVTRSIRIPTIPPSPSPIDGIAIKDTTFDPSTGLSARIFQPTKQQFQDGAPPPPPLPQPLPVVLYFHGGGFVLYEPTHIMFHNFCAGLARAANAIVISVGYRLAPANRLPAAYDDGATAVRWLLSPETNHVLECPADLSRVYLMGDSSGANIVYNVALRLFDTCPTRVAGLVMVQPFFGGVDRTPSELRRERDRVLPLVANDLLWSLALPKNADRDHHFCNFVNFPGLSGALRGFPATLVAVEGLDPLVDRQVEFVNMLRKNGVHVELRTDPEGYHGVQLSNIEKAAALYQDVCKFMSTSASSSL